VSLLRCARCTLAQRVLCAFVQIQLVFRASGNSLCFYRDSRSMFVSEVFETINCLRNLLMLRGVCETSFFFSYRKANEFVHSLQDLTSRSANFGNVRMRLGFWPPPSHLVRWTQFFHFRESQPYYMVPFAYMTLASTVRSHDHFSTKSPVKWCVPNRKRRFLCFRRSAKGSRF
jgi:hypothetical protein